MSKYLKAK